MGGAANGTAPARPAGESAIAPVASRYRRREPERTLLHATVRAHWKTFLAEVEEGGETGASLPRFVVGEFERYLACGILAHGFARVRCTACGDELLVALSCKGRGFCPSCTTRRMHDTAAHLVDRVIPRVPVRQWVLSLPRCARFLLARDLQLVTRTLDIALRAIFAHQRLRARRAGALAPQAGAVTFVHYAELGITRNASAARSTSMCTSIASFPMACSCGRAAACASSSWRRPPTTT